MKSRPKGKYYVIIRMFFTPTWYYTGSGWSQDQRIAVHFESMAEGERAQSRVRDSLLRIQWIN